MALAVDIDPVVIPTFCKRYRIRRLSFFGSVLTENFGPDSDLDVLVEFEPGQVPGLFAVAGMEQELTDLLGRKVDLRTPNDLSRHFRDDVLARAVVQYAA
jgi:predicted nucleotidyltransferase